MDVSEFDPRFRAVINCEAYQKRLNSADCPALVSAFVCAGMLSEAVGKNQEAGWSFLRAAWVSDDNNLNELAVQWRNRAADQFAKAIGGGEVVGKQSGASEAVLVDCLRRAGRAEKALELIGYAERGECDSVIRKVLAFQKSLIDRGDTDRHIIEEALK